MGWRRTSTILTASMTNTVAVSVSASMDTAMHLTPGLTIRRITGAGCMATSGPLQVVRGWFWLI